MPRPRDRDRATRAARDLRRPARGGRASLPVFELGGSLALTLPALAVGPWTRALPSNVSFAPVTDPRESVWRVDLAGGAAASRTALAEGDHSVAAFHAALDDLPRRFEQALRCARTHTPAHAPGPALPTSPTLAISFDASDAESDEREPGRIAQALARVGDLVRGRARIETRIAGRLVACSVISPSGDTESWTAPGRSSADAALHARSVAVAMRTRHAWARMLALVIRCCGRLAAIGVPPAGVAALPLVWRFLRDVLRGAQLLARGAAAPASTG